VAAEAAAGGVRVLLRRRQPGTHHAGVPQLPRPDGEPHRDAGRRLIDYRLRLRGLPLRWRSEITLWEPPVRFADVQRRGPYRTWEHTHTFEEEAGGTMVRDQVLYQLPGPDLLTRAVNALLVEPDTRRIFVFRHAALEEGLGVAGRARAGPVTVVRRRL
jgi:ligand-binding SRPBCC domain-containing protein